MFSKNSGSIFGFVVIAMLVLIALLVIPYITYGNKAHQYENSIESIWENNQQVLGQYTTKIMEMAQVNSMYRDDIKDIFKEVMSGRYGGDGSKAMWQWLQENNPNIDSSIYLKLQQTMDAGREEFKLEQTRLVDTKREYRNQLGYFWSGMWMRSVHGYPKIKIGYPIGAEDDYVPITSSSARESFKSGIDDGVKLR